MANINPETLDWLDELEALKAQKEKTPSASYSKLAKALGLSKAKVTYLSNLTTLLEPAELEKIRQAAPAYTLSYNCAKALAGLKKKVPDPAKTAHESLNLILSRHLALLQVMALVEWMAEGKPAGEFDPSHLKSNKRGPKPKAIPNLKGEKPPNPPSADEPAGPGESPSEGDNPSQPAPLLVPQSLGRRIGLAIDLLLGRPPGQKDSAGSQGARKHGSKGVSPGVKTIKKDGKRAFRVLWHWTLKPIHHFFKAVARWAVLSSSPGLTAFLRWVVYGLCQLVFWWALLDSLAGHFAPGLKPWVEYPFRYLVYLVAVDLPAWGMRLAHEHLAWAIFIGVLLGIAIIGALFAHPLRMGLLLALLGVVWFYGRRTTIEPSPVAGLAMGDKPSTAQISEASAPRENSIAGQTASTLKKTRAPSSHVPPVPEELRDRMEKDSDYTLDFAQDFYGMSYDRYRDWYDWLEDRVSDDYHDSFFKEFNIPSKWREIDGQKLTLSFEPSGKPGLIRWDDVTDDFRVEGVLTTRSDMVYARKLISRKRAALVISFRHKPNGDGSVYKVKETKPAE